MKKIKFLIPLFAVAIAAVGIFLALKSERALVAHPKGIMAHKELHLIKTNIFLMLIIVIPTFVLFFFTAWKFRIKNKKAEYDPEHSHGWLGEAILWIIPSLVIAVMAGITWKAAHELDPYRPLTGEFETLTIQVVAIDWKWLFIYPEQGIATLNFVQFPERTPIHFALAADGSPMNSFWIPQLSGQIYTMTGMVTPLHVMADGPGEYAGRAAEINGQGFASMTFVAKSSSREDFDSWVNGVKQSQQRLSDKAYEALLKPSQNEPVTLFSSVEEHLFHRIVMKYMHPEGH